MRFSGVMLGTGDSKVLGEFYAKVLGAPGFQQDGWYGWAGGTQLMIGNHSDVKGQSELPQRVMLSFEVDDVVKEFERLRGIGAGVVAEPYEPEGGNGVLLATLSDPDGNYLQLAPPWS